MLARKRRVLTEFTRKAVHIVAGISAAFLPFFMPFNAIALLALVFLIVMVLSRVLRVFTSVHNVERRSYGELLFPIAVGAMAVLFPEEQLYMYGILVMAISDGLAGAVGARYGRRTYSIGSARKSYEGSGIFFISCLIITALMIPRPGSVAIVAVLTIVEALSSKGMDNLLLPPTAAVLLLAVR